MKEKKFLFTVGNKINIMMFEEENEKKEEEDKFEKKTKQEMKELMIAARKRESRNQNEDDKEICGRDDADFADFVDDEGEFLKKYSIRSDQDNDAIINNKRDDDAHYNSSNTNEKNDSSWWASPSCNSNSSTSQFEQEIYKIENEIIEPSDDALIKKVYDMKITGQQPTRTKLMTTTTLMPKPNRSNSFETNLQKNRKKINYGETLALMEACVELKSLVEVEDDDGDDASDDVELDNKSLSQSDLLNRLHQKRYVIHNCGDDALSELMESEGFIENYNNKFVAILSKNNNIHKKNRDEICNCNACVVKFIQKKRKLADAIATILDTASSLDDAEDSDDDDAFSSSKKN